MALGFGDESMEDEREVRARVMKIAKCNVVRESIYRYRIEGDELSWSLGGQRTDQPVWETYREIIIIIFNPLIN